MVYPTENAYIALVKLWQLADFFCLYPLHDIVYEARDRHSMHLLRQLNLNSPQDTCDTVAVVEALRTVYMTDTGGAKKIFQDLRDLTVVGYKTFSKDVQFKTLLHDKHQFAAKCSIRSADCLTESDDEARRGLRSSNICLACNRRL